MKSQIKKIGVLAVSIIMSFVFIFQGSTMNAQAEEIEEEPQTVCPYEDMWEEATNTTPTPRWWPGNPNPQPGSEEWMWQNQQYAPPSALARKCALKAIGGGSLNTIRGFLSAGASIGLGIKTFGVGGAVSYTKCIFGL